MKTRAVAMLAAALASLSFLDACMNSGNSNGMTGAGTGGRGAGGQTGPGSGGQAGSGGATGSGGAGGGGSAIPPTFETVKLVFASNLGCQGADCHGGNEHNVLNLAIDDALYGRLTTRVSQACGSIPIVTPGKPAQSALVKILRGPCGMTPRMPYECRDEDDTCTPPEYVTAIERWIANGAPH